MQSLQTRITALLLIFVFVISTLAAPLKDDRLEEGESNVKKVIDGLMSKIIADDTQPQQIQETENGPIDVAEDNIQNEDDDDDDRGQEVINYQDIQVDHDSKVTSENEGKKPETESKEEDKEEFDDLIEDEDEDEDEIEEDDDEQMGVEEGSEYMLTPAAARELMLELRDPVEVAKFVVETDDAAGFLRALRLLLHDGYITEAEAYGLKDEVAAQLRNLLMLQQVELSRALFETYQPQLEEDPTADLDGLLYNQMAQPAEYYDYANMINQEDEVPYGSSQVNIYDAYQDAIEQESTQALAEIAEILAQRIARGEITPEDGAKIMSKVVQLLPDNYWGESEEGMSSEGSEYKEDDLGLSSQTSEFVTEDEIERYGQDEEEIEPEIENFEAELMEQDPQGLVKSIKETDTNGDEDATELEGEAEKIADELEDELLQGGKTSKTESIKIERPGADAVVQVGPSNDVIDQDVEKNWKDMSLLLDQDIPESILRSLGIDIAKPGHEYEGEEDNDEGKEVVEEAPEQGGD